MPPLGGGDGTLNVDSSFKGDGLASFFAVPGACAVFILEYGANFFFGFSFSGVLPLEAGVEPSGPSFS